MSTVLVTGGSEFVGSHVILLLLRAGHVVRTTVRSLDREPSVRAMLRGAGVDGDARLSFVPADSAARQHPPRDEREGRARTGMEATVTRGRDRRHRR
jgi:nucleoside-diphosphate-sugar epimerase